MRAPFRQLRVAVVMAMALSLAVPIDGAAQNLDSVVERRKQLEEQIDEVSGELEELIAALHRTEDELAALEQRAGELERQAAEAEQALQTRARSTFKRGEVTYLSSVLSADGPQGALDRARVLSALSRRDVGALESAIALRQQIDQTQLLLEAKTEELAELRSRLEERNAELQTRFASVQALERELRTRQARQLQITRGAQQGTYACIIAGPYSYRDTWGAPRSGGRRHQGTDVMGRMGAEVYAFTNGRIQRTSTSRLGGIGLYLWGDDGVQYFYAHLQRYAAGIRAGQRVEAGQVIAYNGDTGNARGGPPHVHFEVHPGGGRAVNPYPWLTPVCRR